MFLVLLSPQVGHLFIEGKVKSRFLQITQPPKENVVLAPVYKSQ